ncbi:hypothetical protein ANO11243_017890 [Dothideomycetidae sp. 11243]|nr:hypothetical protein ANO11243_017890 [fungal sp. No.11243]
MPLATLHLLALRRTGADPLPKFLSALKSSRTSPLLVSRVIRWIILPSELSVEHLLSRNIHWDILLVLDASTSIPSSLQGLIEHQWNITAGVPSKLVQDFATKNKTLLHPVAGTVPPLSQQRKEPRQAGSASNLELSGDLQSWIHDFHSSETPEGTGPVSMLNLLCFKPQLKSSYLQYGKEFASSVGSKHGGQAKIVGTVVNIDGTDKKQNDGSWDEIAIAHYPSIKHFADMLANPDYQRVNKKHRLPALKDTCILFTSEMGIETMLNSGPSGKL